MILVVAKISNGAFASRAIGGSPASDVITLNSVNKTAKVEVQTDIAYGLHEVTCPQKTNQDESKEGNVTLKSIKDMVGCNASDATLNFWWVYPVTNAKRKNLKPSTAAEEGFQLFGGYKYRCGSKTKCYALGTGNTLTLSHTAPVPKTSDWHRVTIKGLNYSQFAWVPPDKKTCEHGCFVYKNRLGKTAAMKVGA